MVCVNLHGWQARRGGRRGDDLHAAQAAQADLRQPHSGRQPAGRRHAKIQRPPAVVPRVHGDAKLGGLLDRGLAKLVGTSIELHGDSLRRSETDGDLANRLNCQRAESVSSNDSTMFSATCTTGTMTICAMRSPGCTVKSTLPRFQHETMSWPW